jgi:hypothetical protein
MTLITRISACALAALMAIPAVAQTNRRRAVSPTGQTGATTKIIITARDKDNGVPVETATVTFGGQTVKTNTSGQAALTLPVGKASTISLEHPAFLPFSQTITAQVGGQFDLSLTSRPSVTIKLKNLETHIVDLGTAQFSYAPAFSSNINSDKGNFCKEDGSDFAPDKTEFSRIVGPATPANKPQCCQFGSVLSANAEMKTGEKFIVYFKDNCSGNDVFFVGREKSSGHFQYFRFTDITEVDFP